MTSPALPLHALLFATIGGMGSFVGTMLALWREPWVRRFGGLVVALAAGAMAATAVTHLFPEAVLAAPEAAPLWAMAGFAAFFLLNQWVSFHACSHGPGGIHPIGTLALLGICVHSFFDGIAIGAAFASSEAAGRVVTGAVFAHELPEGAYTYGILLHAGMSRRRAVAWSVFHGLLTPLGAGVAFVVAQHWAASVMPALLGLSAGTFLYVSASTLVPEAQRESRRRGAVAFLAGIGLVLGLMGLASALGLQHGHDHGGAGHAHDAAPADADGHAHEHGPDGDHGP
jgi:zinc transporter ZupT